MEKVFLICQWKKKKKRTKNVKVNGIEAFIEEFNKKKIKGLEDKIKEKEESNKKIKEAEDKIKKEQKKRIIKLCVKDFYASKTHH